MDFQQTANCGEIPFIAGTIMKVQDLHGENWVWRMNAEDMNADLAEKIGQLTGLYGRG